MYPWTPESVLLTIFVALLIFTGFVFLILVLYKKMGREDERYLYVFTELAKVQHFVEYSTKEDKDYDAFMERKMGDQSKAAVPVVQEITPAKKPNFMGLGRGGKVNKKFNATHNIPLNDDTTPATPIDETIIDPIVDGNESFNTEGMNPTDFS